MSEKVIMPAARIDRDGNPRDMGSTYEQGIYYSVIGLHLSQNPYPRNDKFNRRRFEQGFKDHKNGRVSPLGVQP